MASHEVPVKSVCETGDQLLIALKDDEQTALKEKLDDIKNRYKTVSSDTSTRQAHLVEALLLSQQFRDIYKECVTWLDRCEESLKVLDEEGHSSELQQERVKVRNKFCYPDSQNFHARLNLRLAWFCAYTFPLRAGAVFVDMTSCRI